MACRECWVFKWLEGIPDESDDLWDSEVAFLDWRPKPKRARMSSISMMSKLDELCNCMSGYPML